MKVNICGIPHNVIECEDKFNSDCHFGMIDYQACEIRINKDMTEESKKETLCHEMVHGMLIHLGYTSYSSDEQFVQSLSNAIYQGFEVKVESHEAKHTDKGCESCKFEDKDIDEEPCKNCKRSYTDMWEAKR